MRAITNPTPARVTPHLVSDLEANLQQYNKDVTWKKKICALRETELLSTSRCTTCVTRSMGVIYISCISSRKKMVLWGLSCIAVLLVPCINFYVFLLMRMCMFVLSSVAQVSAFLCCCQSINSHCFLRMFISAFQGTPENTPFLHGHRDIIPVVLFFAHPVQEITGNAHSCPPTCKGCPGGLSSGVFALRKCDW